MKETGRILAVDPGEKNIGLALSDPTGLIARPLQVLKHIGLLLDSGQIAQIAQENQVRLVVVGCPTGGNGELIRQSRHSQKLADCIRSQTEIPVVLWDETGSTQKARESLIETGVPLSRRGGHQDALAAAVILQSYLDAHPQSE
jgi:putative Holliday junction resolvase